MGSIVWNLLGISSPWHMVLKLVLGIGLFGYLTLGLASLGLLSKVTFVLVSVASLIYFLNTYGTILVEGKFIKKLKGWCSNNMAFCALFGVLFFLMMTESLAPVTTEDSLNYHFRIPFDYAKNNGLIYSAYQPFNWPQLAEILVSWLFLFYKTDIGAHFVFLLYSSLFIVVFYGFSKSVLLNKKHALLSVLLLATTPMFFFVKISGRVEVLLALFVVASFWCLLTGLQLDKESSRRSWFFLSGALIGCACGVKYYGVLAATLLFIIALSVQWTEILKKKAYAPMLLFCVGAVIFSVPFYLKSIVYTGNPVYPALFDFFGGRDWSNAMATASEVYFNDHKKTGGRRAI